jgi:hypothetical protein
VASSAVLSSEMTTKSNHRVYDEDAKRETPAFLKQEKSNEKKQDGATKGHSGGRYSTMVCMSPLLRVKNRLMEERLPRLERRLIGMSS